MKIYYNNEWIDVDIGDKKLTELNIIIGSSTWIENNVLIGSNVRIGNGVQIGSNVWIENDVRIENDVWIESSTWIGSGVLIRSDVLIESICSKYNCNKYYDEKTKKDYIRIGCEIHPAEAWKEPEFVLSLVRKRKEEDWWESRGRKILQFLLES